MTSSSSLFVGQDFPQGSREASSPAPGWGGQPSLITTAVRMADRHQHFQTEGFDVCHWQQKDCTSLRPSRVPRNSAVLLSRDVTAIPGGGLAILPFSKFGNSGVEGGLVTCLRLLRISDRDMVFVHFILNNFFYLV